MSPTAADLFAGCGGFSYGLRLAGFDIVGAWETDPSARYTYYVHHCEGYETALFGDVTNIDSSKLPDDLDVLAGAPPCQSFSTSQGNVDPNDPRHDLAFAMVDWAEAVEPKVVLIENVVGLKSRHNGIHRAIVDKLKEAGIGYHVNTVTLNAADYGVPQERERVIIMAVRNDLKTPQRWAPTQTANKEPLQTLTGESLRPYSTAKEALDDLPDPIDSQPPADDPVHITIEQYKPTVGIEGRHRVDPHSLSEPIERNGKEIFVPPNHMAIEHSKDVRRKKANLSLGEVINETDRRLHPQQPAPTMTVSEGTPPFHYFGKSPQFPDRSISKVRRLTPREVARLQTFDDAYVFAGTKREQYQMISNAVPPLLANHIGAHTRKNILDHSDRTEVESQSPMTTPAQ